MNIKQENVGLFIRRTMLSYNKLLPFQPPHFRDLSPSHEVISYCLCASVCLFPFYLILLFVEITCAEIYQNEAAAAVVVRSGSRGSVLAS